MKVKFILLLLSLLVAAKAFPQKVVHEEYNEVVGDSMSRFYKYDDYYFVGKTNSLEGGNHAFPFHRVTTSKGDTVVCFVKVGVQAGRHRHVWAEIAAEGQCWYDRDSHDNKFGWFFIGRAERHRKVKWHERIKVSAYIPYSMAAYARPVPGHKKPFTRRVTAYIDYFPFYPWQSMVRFKVKDVGYRTGCEYYVYKSMEQSRKCDEKQAADQAATRLQKERDREKGLKWEKRYVRKYRPDLLHYYEK